MELERNLLHLTPAERENEKGISWQSKEDLQVFLRFQNIEVLCNYQSFAYFSFESIVPIFTEFLIW